MSYFFLWHKELNEAVIHAIEFEVLKKASQQLRSTYYVMTVTEPKENNAMTEAMKDLIQKYFNIKPSRKDLPICFNCGIVGHSKL